ncbi:hypothetical protein Hanom_Chr08g00747891 [Helianthus anomalus]
MEGNRLAAGAVVNGECSATRVAEVVESAAIWGFLGVDLAAAVTQRAATVSFSGVILK